MTHDKVIDLARKFFYFRGKTWQSVQRRVLFNSIRLSLSIYHLHNQFRYAIRA